MSGNILNLLAQSQRDKASMYRIGDTGIHLAADNWRLKVSPPQNWKLLLNVKIE
jgi:hypothetical protein